MSKKNDLEKAIGESEKELELLEKKRLRSLSAFVEAVINHSTPSEEDVEYFRTYSALIEQERENVRKLSEELKELEK